MTTKILSLSGIMLLLTTVVVAQQTFPVNGIPDKRNLYHLFKNARIIVDYKTTLDSSMLLIKNGRIEAVGIITVIPAGTIIHDMSGKWIYPSFIDPYTFYGLPEPSKSEKAKLPQLTSNTKGAYSWNQALKPETEAHRLFTVQDESASRYRKAGFGIVLSMPQDGIARGTGSIVTLGTESDQEVILKEKGAAGYSFQKGTSHQVYPTSEMGAIALLRQSFLDASWYAGAGKNTEFNISIQSWISNQSYPQIFECQNYLQSLRADKIGDEFGVRYIIKGSGDEYKRVHEIQATGNPYIIPLRFPENQDVSNPYDALNLSLGELMHWDLAPANAAILHHAGIPVVFTSDGLKDIQEFIVQLRKTISYGLPVQEALKAVTESPARLLGIENLCGAIRKGMMANFLITSGDIFKKDHFIFENWINGKPYVISQQPAVDIRGEYSLMIDTLTTMLLSVKGESYKPQGELRYRGDTIKASVTFNDHVIAIGFELKNPAAKGRYTLNGFPYGDDGRLFKGTAINPQGLNVLWELVRTGEFIRGAENDTTTVEIPSYGTVTYPAKAYGFKTLPAPENIIFRNVTVWTNESSGILKDHDVRIRNGKIESIGRNLDTTGYNVIDGTGKHLTSGIIDEHSHIAVSHNVNECSHAVTSEVRISDVIDPDDIQIYRQLAGGVTTSQLLHGSCNPIGGQSAIIKLRWGFPAEQMKFQGAPGFIKFALGENVKQSNWGDDNRIRYPQTRMGVEQVYINAFTKAIEYHKTWQAYNPKSKLPAPRRDLQLEALTEIMNRKRFITCHSYQQGEINMLMHVADSMGFKVNTFTHILEGYKVADKMKAHGAGASSFSDWWAYKYEVIEAIPHNGSILHDMGVITAFNSDDAEMARRLNQEAAKAVMYGGLSDEDAWKFVTLNPARLLRIDHLVGSIKAGKDADVVLWNGPPLSVYSKVEKTYIDGICFFDLTRDAELRSEIQKERARILNKMRDEKNKSPQGDLKKPAFREHLLHHCDDVHDDEQFNY